MKNTTTFPSNTSWITPRVDGVKLETSNCQIILSDNTSSVRKMLVKADTVQVSYVAGGTNATYSNPGVAYLNNVFLDSGATMPVTELDITKFIVENAKYQTLTAENGITYNQAGGMSLYKNNCSYYEQNTNTIHLINDIYKHWAIPAPAFYSLVNSAFQDLVLSKPIYNSSGYLINSAGSVSASGQNPITYDIRNCQFRIYYTPISSGTKLKAYKTNAADNDFEIPFNQQQQMNSATALGRNMQSLVNRLGTKEMQVVKRVYYIKDLMRPGTRYVDKNGEEWLVTVTHVVIRTLQFMDVTYTLTQGWNGISPYAGVDRKFRSWKIPAEIVQRELHYEDFCVITKTKYTDSEALPTAEAMREVLRGLDTTYSGKFTECNNLWFINSVTGGSQGAAYRGVALTCSSFGFGNSLVFTGKTKDNLSAGVQRNATEDAFCQDVYYCNEDGTQETLWVTIGSAMRSNTDNAANLYPYYSETYTTSLNAITNAPDSTQGLNLFKNIDFDVQKDPAEQLNFTYQLHICTNIPNVVIGTGWANINPLVKQRDGTATVKAWGLSRRLPHGAQVMSANWGTQFYNALSNYVAFDYNNLAFTMKQIGGEFVGLVLTDGDNNILFAQNVNETNTYYLCTAHELETFRKWK